MEVQATLVSKIRELPMPPEACFPGQALVRGCPSAVRLPQQVQSGHDRQTDRRVHQTSSRKEPAGLRDHLLSGVCFALPQEIPVAQRVCESCSKPSLLAHTGGCMPSRGQPEHTVFQAHAPSVRPFGHRREWRSDYYTLVYLVGGL